MSSFPRRSRHLCAICLLFSVTATLGAEDLRVLAIDPLADLEVFDRQVDFGQDGRENPAWRPLEQVVPAAAIRDRVLLIAPRGGVASAPVLASGAVRARLDGPLRGENGDIPLESTNLRYATYRSRNYRHWRKPNWRIAGDKRRRGGTLPDDYQFWWKQRPYTLQSEPADHPGVHPIWLSVRVSVDAAPGTYRSELSVGGHSLPVELTVSPFVMPRSGEDVAHIGAMWSYQRLAEHFDVEPWSPEHVSAMSQLHAHLTDLGNDPLVLTMLADGYLGDDRHHNYLGDEHAMLRFRRDGDALVPDWNVVDLVLERYQAEVGNPSHVVLHCWSQPLFGIKTKHVRSKLPAPDEVRLAVTVVEADGSLGRERITPPYFDEHRELWRRVFAELEQRLETRGLRDRLILGSASDGRPRKQTVDAFAALGHNDWLVCSHGRGVVLPQEPGEGLVLGSGMRVAYWEHVYAPGLTLREDGILGGWNAPFIQYSAMRNYLKPADPLTQYRGIVDAAIATGEVNQQALESDDLNQSDRDQFARGIVENAYSASGLTRLPLLPGDHHKDGLNTTFPGVIRGNPRFLLTVDGEVLQPTVRWLMLLESRQEAEARIVLERALVEGRLPEDRAAEVRAFLRERIRHLTRDGAYSSAGGLDDGSSYSSRMLGVADDWQAVTTRLFELAGEVQER